MRRIVLWVVTAGLLAGCSTWGRGIQRPPQRTHDEQVEARRDRDAKTNKCVIEQTMRRQQKEQGRDVRPFPKEKC